ncbi:hypothetical protein FEM48_Zijuj11G0150900 [Ziziphus jujuba var. spinosa]|uniref:Peroxidase n=1 Tax=Ziziphus jujuba var. spinosa TaxID=714518 RepID=A0A978UJM9_ZIZJJ|nr:hypothetical protein FEM48_Zijuj11G0150900 [Ziziphus jujuba var. spinosa]
MVHGQGLHVGFYKATCPKAEVIVRSTVGSHFNSNPSIAPALLNLHFHDCFVRGCDASILIDGPTAEKMAEPNLELRGYNVIEDAKSQLEDECPGVVSCADILALAARDSVVLMLSIPHKLMDTAMYAHHIYVTHNITKYWDDILDKIFVQKCTHTHTHIYIYIFFFNMYILQTGGPSWSVPTGRRDGRVSIASNVNFPSFRDSTETLTKKFAEKGLNVLDFVTLVGAHTIGTSACQFFSYRLYNFSAANSVDPSMVPVYATQLQKLCPQNGDATARVALDTVSPHHFDVSLNRNLRNGRGILEVDQKLWSDVPTRNAVQHFLVGAGSNFHGKFGSSMVKMGNIDVKTGTEGEIRRICSAIN